MLLLSIFLAQIMGHLEAVVNAKFLCLCAALIVAGPAKAQDCCAAMDMTGMGIYAMEESMNSAARETSSTQSDKPKKPVTNAIADLTYRFSAPRRQSFMRDYVSRLKRQNPGNEAMVSQNYEQQDVLGMMDAGLRSYGMNPQNVAHAYATYWVNAWSIANRDYSETSRATMLAVAKQSEAAMSRLAIMANTNDATKQ